MTLPINGSRRNRPDSGLTRDLAHRHHDPEESGESLWGPGQKTGREARAKDKADPFPAVRGEGRPGKWSNHG